MDTETTPEYEKNMNSINFNLPAEPTLVAPPSLDVARAMQETQQIEQVTEASNLNGEASPNYNGTIVHTQHIISHTPTQNGEEDRSQPLEEHDPIEQSIYDRLNVHDILPLEVARPRLLNILLDHFIEYHLIPATEETLEKSSEKIKKRKIGDLEEMPKVAYEGDPNFILPLLFVVNAYETLVTEINSRMSEIEGLQGKSIGLALEAAGGLYRRLIEKFPKSGSLTSFKRKELASADEARKRFPHLVGTDEKRVRFIVVQGLELVERSSTMPSEDAEWFKRVTGRPDPILYPSDYNFFSQRTKARKSTSNSTISQPALMDVLRLSGHPHPQQESPQSQSPTRVQSQTQTPSSALLGLSPPSSQPTSQSQSQLQRHLGLRHNEGTPSQHVQPRHLDLMGHLAQVVHQTNSRLPSLAKYCDECGTQFVRDASKFCSECGAKRFGT